MVVTTEERARILAESENAKWFCDEAREAVAFLTERIRMLHLMSGSKDGDEPLTTGDAEVARGYLHSILLIQHAMQDYLEIATGAVACLAEEGAPEVGTLH